MEILEKIALFVQFMSKKLQFSANFWENIHFYSENQRNSWKTQNLRQKLRPRIPRVTGFHIQGVQTIKSKHIWNNVVTSLEILLTWYLSISRFNRPMTPQNGNVGRLNQPLTFVGLRNGPDPCVVITQWIAIILPLPLFVL